MHPSIVPGRNQYGFRPDEPAAAYLCHPASETQEAICRAPGESKLFAESQEELFRTATAPQGDVSDLPRTILVFAHPDDETVALGARLGRFGPAHFVHVTDGAPRNEQDSQCHGFASWREYRQARAEEFSNLLTVAGIPTATHDCLEIPDQEASRQLAPLARQLADLVRQYKPEVIFTHPYEGGHPDHDACAFAVHHAVALCGKPVQPVPVVIEGAFYNAAASQPGNFLPHEDVFLEREYRLTTQEQQRKQALINCFRSQRETLQGFPLEWERFRCAPAYDFRTLPHSPPLLYDRYPWGTTSRQFNQLARDAEDVLHDTA